METLKPRFRTEWIWLYYFTNCNAINSEKKSLQQQSLHKNRKSPLGFFLTFIKTIIETTLQMFLMLYIDVNKNEEKKITWEKQLWILHFQRAKTKMCSYYLKKQAIVKGQPFDFCLNKANLANDWTCPPQFSQHVLRFLTTLIWKTAANKCCQRKQETCIKWHKNLTEDVELQQQKKYFF